MLVFSYPSVRYLGGIKTIFFLHDVEKLRLTLAFANIHVKIIILHTKIYDKKRVFLQTFFTQ